MISKQSVGIALFNAWRGTGINIAIVGIMLAVVWTATRVYGRYKRYQSIPGHPTSEYSLVFGNVHLVPKSPEERLKHALKQMHRFNFKFHRFWVGPFTPIVSIYHPESVKKLFLSSAPKSRGFGAAYELVLGWIGEGLISTNGKRWVRSRKLLTPAFHLDILKDYMKIYNEAAANLCKKIDKFAENGKSFDFYPMVTLATLETILKCALSYDADVQGAGHPYAEAVADLAHIWSERARKPWLWPDWTFRLSSMGKCFFKNCDYVHRIAEEIIDKRRQALKEGGHQNNRRMDFIDLLLTSKDNDGQTMTNLEIRNEVDTFMFAGHDTTASAISWCLTSLAQHPEYQEKIHEEIDNFMEGRDSDELQWDDLSHLKTLTICFKETMRLYATVPFIQRKLNKDMELEGHVIPEGTIVSVAIYLLHRNPTVWDDPEEFRPERFLIENKKTFDPYAYVPFSAGARNCIGQNFALHEAKVTLSRILRRYKVEPAPDRETPVQKAAAILRAENGMWLRIKRR